MKVKDWLVALGKEPPEAIILKDGVELTLEDITIKLPIKTEPMPSTDLGLKPNQDNYDTLQKLFNDYAKRGEKLILPKGIYLTSKTLSFPLGLDIEGTETELVLTGNSTDNRYLVYIDKGQNNIRAKGIVFNANRKDNTGKNVAAMFVHDDVKGLDLIKCSFKGGKTIGTLTIKGVYSGGKDWLIENVNILECSFSDSGMANIELRGVKNCRIWGCTFTEYGVENKETQAIQMQSVPCENVAILNNTFNNTHCDQFAIETAQAMMKYVTIVNNKFNDVSGLGGTGISGYFDYAVISDNKFTGGIGNHRSGLEIFGEGNTITDNYLPKGSIVYNSGNPQRQETTKEKGNFAVLGNIVNSAGDNTNALTLAGTAVMGLNKGIVYGNALDSSAGKGTNSADIAIGSYGSKPTAVKNILITGNDLKANKDNSAVRLEAGAGSENIEIRQNKIKDAFSYANYKTDAIQKLNFTENELVNLKQNGIYLSGTVKVNSTSKIQ